MQDLNLADAVFDRCTLKEAKLRECILDRARITAGNCVAADFASADLNDAVFSGVDLTGARFTGALLADAQFMECRMIGADLTALRGLAATLTIKDCNLQLAGLQDTNLRGADLSGSDLTEADLRGADLRDAGLNGCRLRHVDLSHTRLDGTDLRGADLGEITPPPRHPRSMMTPLVVRYHLVRGPHHDCVVHPRGTAVIARWLRRAWRRYRGQVAGAAALAALVLGVAGYGEQDPQLSLADRLYDAIQLFSMSGGANKPPIPPALQVARWLAPLTVAYAALRTLSAIFLRQWTQTRIRLVFRHHVIVCGLGQAGLRFATGFHDRGDRVVVIDRTPPVAEAEKCRDLGIPVLTGDATDELILARAGLGRARYLVAVCGQDTANAEVALAITAASTRRRLPIDCLVQLADEQLCQLVDQQALTATPGPVTYEFFNTYQAGPAALFDTHPDLLVPQASIPPHLMVLGTGRFATTLIAEAARRWRLDRDHSAGRIRITLVAPDAAAQAAALGARYPALGATCELRVHPSNPSDPDAATPLPPIENPHDDPGAALVCLGEDGANFRATLVVRRRLPEGCPVIVCTTGQSSLAELLNRSASGMLANVEGFSLLDRVCRPEVLLNGGRETLAQAIHADYVRRRREHGASLDDPALAAWEVLPETVRAANRAQAGDLGEKLRTIGCELVPATDWDTPPLPFTPAEVERLAVAEHQRWAAERRRDGWRPGPARDPVRKLSPYLVSWEILPEEVKDLDRDAVRALPTFLARAGFATTRRTPPPH